MRRAGWKLRSRDKGARGRGDDVLAARTGTEPEQPVGSRLTQPQGVGAPAVTGEDVTTVEPRERAASKESGTE